MLDQCGLLPNFLRNSNLPITTSKVEGDPVVELIYIFVANNQSYRNLAIQFVESYLQNPPGADHKTTIVCNRGKPDEEMKKLFGKLPNVTFFQHDNSGYDIGAYQHVARQSTSDLLLCCSASTYFNGVGWMRRVIESFLKHGDCLYGTMGNKGDARYQVNRHIRSTGFWITPSLLRQYPLLVTTVTQRYEFEHRKNCLTEWCLRGGVKALVVSWDNEYEWEHWDDDPQGFHRGEQKSVFICDHINKLPYYPK